MESRVESKITTTFCCSRFIEGTSKIYHGSRCLSVEQLVQLLSERSSDHCALGAKQKSIFGAGLLLPISTSSWNLVAVSFNVAHGTMIINVCVTKKSLQKNKKRSDTIYLIATKPNSNKGKRVERIGNKQWLCLTIVCAPFSVFKLKSSSTFYVFAQKFINNFDRPNELNIFCQKSMIFLD